MKNTRKLIEETLKRRNEMVSTKELVYREDRASNSDSNIVRTDTHILAEHANERDAMGICHALNNIEKLAKALEVALDGFEKQHQLDENLKLYLGKEKFDYLTGETISLAALKKIESIIGGGE